MSGMPDSATSGSSANRPNLATTLTKGTVFDGLQLGCASAVFSRCRANDAVGKRDERQRSAGGSGRLRVHPARAMLAGSQAQRPKEGK